MNQNVVMLRIADLLAVSNLEHRWILVKKALAADVRQSSTKAIEFAYRDLEHASAHLREIAEERTEYLSIPLGFEPEDEADRISGSPKLMDFCRGHSRKPSRPTAVRARETEIETSPDVDAVASHEPIRTTSSQPAEEEARVAEESQISEVVVAEPDAEPDIEVQPVFEAPADPVDEAVTDMVDEAVTDMVDEKEAVVDLAKTDVAEEAVLQDPGLGLDGGHEPEARGEVPDGHFRITLQQVMEVSDPRVRWIMLKKLVAFSIRKSLVRSVPPALLQNDANAAEVLRRAGGVFDVPLGREPGDNSDHSSVRVSLERFALTGDWSMPSLPKPVLRRNQKAEGPALLPLSETAPSGSETDAVEQERPEVTATPVAAPSSQRAEQDDLSLRLDVQAGTIVLSGGSSLRKLIDAGLSPLGQGERELVARILEAEAARLRLMGHSA